MNSGRLSRRAPAFRSVVSACALILLGACGGSAGDSAPPAAAAQAARGDLDPCALVTRAEAATALGAAVDKAERPPEANIPPRLMACRYIAPRGQALAVMTVMVRTGSDSESRIGFRSAKDTFDQAQTVAGVGDDAFVLGDQFHVLRGNFHLILSGDISTDAARALAQTALGRLG